MTQLDGYDIGGKTGTAQKTINGKISKQTYSSVVAVAPTEDPKFTLLCIVDSPKEMQYGSATLLSERNGRLSAKALYSSLRRRPKPAARSQLVNSLRRGPETRSGFFPSGRSSEYSEA